MRKQLKKGFKPLAGPLELEVRIYLARPKSLPKKIKHAAKKPDLDNLVKLFLDAMNGVVFVDDAQIIHFEAWKSFRPEEGATITVREVESEEKNDGRQKTLTLV
jgi:Holliday junction resolvase RusA-like endonuclease